MEGPEGVVICGGAGTKVGGGASVEIEAGAVAGVSEVEASEGLRALVLRVPGKVIVGSFRF